MMFAILGVISGMLLAGAFRPRQHSFEPFLEKTWRIEFQGRTMVVILGETFWHKRGEGHFVNLRIRISPEQAEQILEYHLDRGDRLADGSFGKVKLVESPVKPVKLS